MSILEKSDKENKRILTNSHWAENKLKSSLEASVHAQSQLFLHCSNCLSPFMDVAGIMQENYGDINLRFGTLGEIVLYAAQVCVNASTQQFHT